MRGNLRDLRYLLHEREVKVISVRRDITDEEMHAALVDLQVIRPSVVVADELPRPKRRQQARAAQ